MLYLGIDQHKSQLTVNLRGEDGEVVLKRQVSTGWEKVRAFFADLAEKARPEGGFMAIVEVCGMNAWLLEMLKSYGCAEIVVTQPGDVETGTQLVLSVQRGTSLINDSAMERRNRPGAPGDCSPEPPIPTAPSTTGTTTSAAPPRPSRPSRD